MISTNIHLNSIKITIRNLQINWLPKLKYLGIILDSKFNFAAYVKIKELKATIRFENIMTLLWNKDLTPKTKLTLDKGYIRSILTYAYPLCLGAAKTNKNMLESVQRRAIRIMASLPSYMCNLTIDPEYEIETSTEHTTHFFRNMAYKLETHTNPNLKHILTIEDIKLISKYHTNISNILVNSK